MRVLQAASVGALTLMLWASQVPAADANRYLVHQCVGGQSSPNFWSALPRAGPVPGTFYVDQGCTAMHSGSLGVTTQGDVFTPSSVPWGTQVSWQFAAPAATRIVAVGGTANYQPAPYGRQFEAQVWDPDTGAALGRFLTACHPSCCP